MEENNIYFELSDEQFNIVECFFTQNNFHIPVLSVIHKKFPGRIFVDDRNNPTIVFVWVISRWSYLYYFKNNINIYTFIRDIINKEIKHILDKLRITDFEIYVENKDTCIYYLEKQIENMIVSKHYENYI